MIAANELRIGNWVMHGTNYRIVKAIHNSYIQFTDGLEFVVFPISLDKIASIPLTPSILEKCGFVLYYDDDTFENKKYFKKDGFNDLADYGGQCIVLTDKGNYLECGYYSNQISCESLHQLQNLYFVLTGEELEITM